MKVLTLLVLLAVAGWLFMRRDQMTVSDWVPPVSADPWLIHIRSAEVGSGIPNNLLTRLLWQESRFRSDIISGQVQSSAGAVGIAQIIPRWHPGVNPTDPVASINYAAGYLRQLYDQFGSWPLALAAYNWGPGNLSNFGIDQAPSETRELVSSISADMGLEWA